MRIDRAKSTYFQPAYSRPRQEQRHGSARHHHQHARRASQKERLQEAAELAHTTLSEFILDAAEEKADQVIADHATTWVPSSYFDELYASLDAPPQPDAALAAAAARPAPVSQR